MSTTLQQLGRQLARLRRARGLTQAQLAAAVDIEEKSLSRIENGRSAPSLESLDAMREALSASWADLMGFETETLAAGIRTRLMKRLVDADLRELLEMERRLGR